MLSSSSGNPVQSSTKAESSPTEWPRGWVSSSSLEDNLLFTTLLFLAEEASGQLPGSISWKKFTMGQTINERKVGQRDPATGPSFKEKALAEPHKVLEDNHEAVSRCFRDHQEEVRPRGGVHLGRSLHHKLNVGQ